MPSTLTRRQVLGAGGGLGLLALAGCVSDVSTGDESSATTERTTPSPDARTDDLYVDNRVDEERRVSVRLERSADGETTLDGTYLLPARTRIRVSDVGREGDAYEVTVTASETLEETWEVRTCEGTEAPKGNRDAEVRIEDGGLDFRANACDAVFVEPSPSEPAEEYRVEQTETDGG